jgi:hypothetical protein
MTTQARLKELFTYDPDTGIMRRISTGRVVGNRTRDRLQLCVDGYNTLIHRYIWVFVHGHWPEFNIDHIDGNPMNNRIDNLRDVPQQINTQNNRKPRSNNGSGFLGVHFDKSRGLYKAEITLDGRNRYLGRFKTPEEAHEVYLKAKRKLHDGCTI